MSTTSEGPTGNAYAGDVPTALERRTSPDSHGTCRSWGSLHRGCAHRCWPTSSGGVGRTWCPCCMGPGLVPVPYRRGSSAAVHRTKSRSSL